MVWYVHIIGLDRLLTAIEQLHTRKGCYGR
jgi:hypothetical protein